MMTIEIFQETEGAFKELLRLISSLDQEQLNAVPFKGSWTAGQVGEHLLKSYDLIETLDGNTSPTRRKVDEKVGELKEVFLNFDIKMQSPDFIVPSNGQIDKERLLLGLKEKCSTITAYMRANDLSLTCLDFEFPNIGALTRLEWIHFISYHTQRHNHQLKKIIKQVANENLTDRPILNLNTKIQLNPYLSFNGKCREAMTFYQNLFGGELTLQSVEETPLAAQCPTGVQDQIMHAMLAKNEFVLMATDMTQAEGHKVGNDMCLSLALDNEEAINDLYARLSDGGKVIDSLKESFWGALFGVVEDKFGKVWMLNCDKKQSV